MSGAGKPDPSVTTDLGPVSEPGRQPSSTYVPRHDRELTHFGLMEASLVEIAEALGVHPAATDLQTVLEYLDGRISELEAVTRRYGAFTLDAVIFSDRAFTLDAILRQQVTGSATLDALLQAARSGSLTADAVLRREVSGTALLDAVLRAAQAGSFTADAVLRASQAGAFTLDAFLFALGGFGDFTLDAILRREMAANLALDATLRMAVEAGFPIDSVLRREISGTIPLDSVLRRAGSGTFTLDAVLNALGYTFTLDATIRKTYTLRPSSDVTSSGTINRSSGTANWSLIDETPNSNSDYVDVDSANSYFIVGITSPGLVSTNVIQKVTIEWRGTNGAPSSTFRTAIRNPSTGTVYESSASIGATIAQNATSATHDWGSSRPWGGSWTYDDINNLQFGGHTAGSGPYNNRTGSMWAVVRVI